MRETRLWILGFDPSSVGYEASIWEQAKNTVSGIIYVKVGPDNTDWVPAPIGGSSGPVISVNGTAGRISSSGGNSPVIDLVNTAVTPGSYTYSAITVDASGRITAASNGTTPAPVDATYITQTPSGTLTNEQALSALSSGVMQVTTTTGVVDSFVVGTGLIPYGSSSKLATASTFGYNAANGTLAVGVAPGSAISTVKAHIAGSANGEVSIVVQNTNSGSSAYASLYFLNDTAGRRADVYFTSTTYSGADAGPSSVVFSTSPSSGSVIFAPKLVRTLSLDGSNSNFEAGNALFTRAGVQLIEKQGSGDFYVGTLGAQLLGLYTNNVTRVSIASGGGVTLSSLTGATTGIVSASTTGLLGRASSADIAGNITWPAAEYVLFSGGTSSAPVSHSAVLYDTANDLFELSDDANFALYNLGSLGTGNYERLHISSPLNVFTLKSEKGGTGTVRSMTVDADTATLTLRANSTDVHGAAGIGLGLLAGVRSTPQVTIGGTTSVTIAAGSSGSNPTASFAASQLLIDTSISISAGFPGGQLWDGVKVTGNATLPGTGTVTAAFASWTFNTPTITGTGVGATVNEAATVLIKGGPTASALTINVKHALWVQADAARFDGDLMLPGVANGSVATVLGSLGPAGSHTTVQKWFVWKDTGGTAYYVPGF